MPFPVPNGEASYFDLNGNPLTGGQVFYYIPGTTSPSPTWADEGMTVQNPNPITLDQAGRCVVWGDGLYRQVVHDMFGNLIWDQTTGIVIDHIPGNLQIDGTLNVNGKATFQNGVDINGSLFVSGSQTLEGGLSVGGNETVGGTLTVQGLISGEGGLTINGTTNLNGPTNINGTLNVPSGNITAGPGFCVVTDCIEHNVTNFVDIQSSVAIHQTPGINPAFEIVSFDPNSYITVHDARVIQIVSNDNPTLDLVNTSSGINWAIWGGATLNFGFGDAVGDPRTPFATMDISGNLNIAGTLTQGQPVLASSAAMTDGALSLVNSTPVKTLPHIGFAQSDAPVLARAAAGPGVNSEVMLGILWKAVQELSAKVP